MWEEPLDSLRVTHRLSVQEYAGEIEVHSDESDEWLKVDANEPLLPPSSLGTAVGGVDEDADTELGATESDGGVVTLPPETGPRPDDGTRPESVVFEPPNCRQILSSFGEEFTSKQDQTRPGSSHRPKLYALLTAEEPFFQRRATNIAHKFVTVAGGSTRSIHPVRWDKPDFAVLYSFDDTSGYKTLVSSLREGKLKNVKDFRAVTLQPVRVIDKHLKATVELAFPSAAVSQVKSLLSPLFALIPVTTDFIFIPLLPPSYTKKKTPQAINRDDFLPPVVFTLITHLPQTTAAKDMQKMFDSPDWSKVAHEFPDSPFKSSELFYHHNHRTILPLFSLTSAQLRSRESLEVTLICGSPREYTDTVNFYRIVFKESDPVSHKNYTRFSLMHSATSNLSLCVYMTESISTSPLSTFTMHCYLSDLVCVVVQLVKCFRCDFTEVSRDVWLTSDPAGHRVLLHNVENMSHTEQ